MRMVVQPVIGGTIQDFTLIRLCRKVTGQVKMRSVLAQGLEALKR